MGGGEGGGGAVPTYTSSHCQVGVVVGPSGQEFGLDPGVVGLNPHLGSNLASTPCLQTKSGIGEQHTT